MTILRQRVAPSDNFFTGAGAGVLYIWLHRSIRNQRERKVSAVIEISVAKNRIYLGLEGYFRDEEAQQLADKVITEIGKLRPGFDLVNDISKFMPASQAAAGHFLRVQGVMKERGVRRIVRVVAGNALGNMQVGRAATQSGLEAQIASTRQEAERLLDQAR